MRRRVVIGSAVIGAVVLVVISAALKQPQHRSGQRSLSAPANAPDAAGRDGAAPVGKFPGEPHTWLPLTPREEECDAVLSTLRPVTDARASAMSDAWLLMLLHCHCSGHIVLTDAEIASLLAALRRTPSLDYTDPYAVPLLRLLANRADLMPPRAWGMALSAAGATASGGMMRADEVMVDIAASLLAVHPAQDSEWWRGVWGGLSEDERGFHPRRAVCEAIGRLPDAVSRQEAWRSMASLEAVENPAGNTGLLIIGLSMRGQVESSIALESMARESDASWRRALLWSLEPEDLWPQRRDGVDAAIARSVLDVLRAAPPESAAERYWRLDLIGRSWGLLGPTVAVQEFADFVASSRGDIDEAALRLAVAAYEVGMHEATTRSEDQRAFDRGEQEITALFATPRYPLDRLLSLALMHPKLNERVARDVLIRALGSRVTTLSMTTYDRLVR